MHAPASNGPQIGYAVVLAGTAFRSTETRPALALIDLRIQISRANPARYAHGQPALEAPATVGQLLPLYRNANPALDAALKGTQQPRTTIGCGTSATDNHPRHSHPHNERRRTDPRRIAGSVMA